MTKAEIIARLEGATPCSRELDAEIRKLCGVIIPWEHMRNDLNARPEWNTHGQYIPFYTSSVDAALTLITAEWTAWRLRSTRCRTAFVCELSRLTAPDQESEEEYSNGRAASAALAVCIAALRGRS